MLVLERNPMYHGRFAGNVERVELSLRPAGEWLAQLEMYEADCLDILRLGPSPGRELDRVRQRHGAEYVSFQNASTHYLGFDVARPPFDDLRLRQAFALALDRQALADATGGKLPATGGFVPPGMPGHVPGIALPFDPERASDLVADAGYAGRNGFPEVELVASRRLQGLCEGLQQQWAEHLGITIRWRLMAWSDLLALLDEKVPALFLMGWSADYPDPDSFLRVGIPRRTPWQHEGYLDRVHRARRSTDQAERMAHYAQAERILAEQVPCLPLFYGRAHFLLKPWVRRYPTSVFGDLFWKDVVIEPH
jgi:ABC-type oligopeptide transport system substrate-binding subunit